MTAEVDRHVLAALASGASFEDALSIGARSPDRRIQAAFEEAQSSLQSSGDRAWPQAPLDPAIRGLCGPATDATRPRVAERLLPLVTPEAKRPSTRVGWGAGHVIAGAEALLALIAISVLESFVAPVLAMLDQAPPGPPLTVARLALWLGLLVAVVSFVLSLRRRNSRQSGGALDAARALHVCAAAIAAGLPPAAGLRALSERRRPAAPRAQPAIWIRALGDEGRSAAALARAGLVPATVADVADHPLGDEPPDAAWARAARLAGRERRRPVAWPAYLAIALVTVGAGAGLIAYWQAIFHIADGVR